MGANFLYDKGSLKMNKNIAKENYDLAKLENAGSCQIFFYDFQQFSGNFSWYP